MLLVSRHRVAALSTFAAVLHVQPAHYSVMATASQLPPPPSIIYGTAWKEDETSGFVATAFQTGFRAFDTANQPKHYNEAQVGLGLGKMDETKRQELFIQTKFTHISGQDERVPYDKNAPTYDQVHQSFASSLEHLGTTYLDSYLLHGPSSGGSKLGADDYEVWRAMTEIYGKQKEEGTLALGVSNVNKGQLLHLIASGKQQPHYVQNRCVSATGWDRAVRKICKQHGIRYQGFGLLTWSRHVMDTPLVKKIAKRTNTLPAQVVLAFAKALGIIPVVGPKQQKHMQVDLDLSAVVFEANELDLLENIGGEGAAGGAVTVEFANGYVPASGKDQRLQVLWESPEGELHLQGELGRGETFQVNSFHGHTFVVKDSNGGIRWSGVVSSENGANQYLDVSLVEKDEL